MITRTTKQVIVIRRDLKNIKGEKVRSGKIAAQVSHASMSFLTRQLQGGNDRVNITNATREWIESGFTKVCVSVQNEEELMNIYNQAKEKGLEVHLITDNGYTEFGGIPTKTCLAIGPAYSEEIDEITKHLSLY